MDTQTGIKHVCEEVKALLLEKNKSYGDSAMHPINIFSNVTAQEQMNVRIDDKLNRIKRGKEYKGDDTELDLIGYLILKRVERKINGTEKKAERDPDPTPIGLSSNSRQNRERDKLLDIGCSCADCAQQERRFPSRPDTDWKRVVPKIKESDIAKGSPVLR